MATSSVPRANDNFGLSEHQRAASAKVAQDAITAFNIAQFAYMVKKMHSLREGDGIGGTCHPGIATHQAMADILVREIRRVLGW